MSFSSPYFLFALLLVPAVLGLALWFDRRRARYAVAFTSSQSRLIALGVNNAR